MEFFNASHKPLEILSDRQSTDTQYTPRQKEGERDKESKSKKET